MYTQYQSKNSGAVCYLICCGLLDLDTDVEVMRNQDGFVLLAFAPTDARMDAFRKYVSCFRGREELLVDIVAYNATFSRIKSRIDAYKVSQGLK